MNYIPMTCGNCDYNDGLVYTSLPPKSKCTITNEFYECDHKCHLVFTAAEPIDAVEVVRCKDCKYNYHNMISGGEADHECMKCVDMRCLELPITADFYCAWGERKDVGE